jgi:nitroreductase
MQPEQPPRDLIETIVEAGRWAPNHHLTQPWRFFVLAGNAREALGEAMAAAAARAGGPGLDGPKATAETRRAILEKERQKPLRAPVVVVVAVEPSSAPNVVRDEELWAGATAAQNILLAAHAVGLAARWRTGPAAFAPEVRDHLGLGPTAQVIGFLYIGYPTATPAPAQRTELPTVVNWLGWPDA